MRDHDEVPNTEKKTFFSAKTLSLRAVQEGATGLSSRGSIEAASLSATSFVLSTEKEVRDMTATYHPELTLRDARALYFERNGIPEDGGYSKRWVKVTQNRLPLYLLNTPPRQRAVPYHDLHHVLTEYETSNTGEAEISAWELAAGTSPHWIALFLDLTGLAVGLVIAPRRTFRAFLRGRRSRSLYAESLNDELLSASLGNVRARLGIAPGVGRANAGDVVAFTALSLAGLVAAVSLVVFAPLFLVIGLLLQ